VIHWRCVCGPIYTVYYTVGTLFVFIQHNENLFFLLIIVKEEWEKQKRGRRDKLNYRTKSIKTENRGKKKRTCWHMNTPSHEIAKCPPWISSVALFSPSFGHRLILIYIYCFKNLFNLPNALCPAANRDRSNACCFVMHNYACSRAIVLTKRI
jgi:hypothetical protein